MNLDIAGALLGPNRADHIMEVLRRAARIGEHCRCARDLLEMRCCDSISRA